MHMIQYCGLVAVYLRSSTMTMLKGRRGSNRGQSEAPANKLHAHMNRREILEAHWYPNLLCAGRGRLYQCRWAWKTSVFVEPTLISL